MTMEEKVLDVLVEDDGTDPHSIALQTGLTRAQITATLQRLRKKGLASCARWHETSIWWKGKQ